MLECNLKASLNVAFSTIFWKGARINKHKKGEA